MTLAKLQMKKISFEQILRGIAWSPLMTTHMQVPASSVCHKQGPSWLDTL
jgi:hypothetical protein